MLFCAADPVATELSRLESAAAAIHEAKLHEQLRDMVPVARERVTAAKAIEQPLLRLYRLRDAYLITETLAWAASHPDANQRLEAFETLWKRERPRFAVASWKPHPTLVRAALVEAAANRAEKLSKASLPYARVSSPFSGVYYLGEGSANLGFAHFVDSLPKDEQRERRPDKAALVAAADALEAEMLAFFEKDPTNRAAIPVSAKFKEMRELLDANALDGATLLLLETRLELSRRQNAETTPTPTTTTPTDSMGALWHAVADADDKGPTREIIHTAVLPLYRQIMRN